MKMRNAWEIKLNRSSSIIVKDGQDIYGDLEFFRTVRGSCLSIKRIKVLA